MENIIMSLDYKNYNDNQKTVLNEYYNKLDNMLTNTKKSIDYKNDTEEVRKRIWREYFNKKAKLIEECELLIKKKKDNINGCFLEKYKSKTPSKGGFTIKF
jgi:hypothetical protein